MRTSFLNSMAAVSAALFLGSCIDNDFDAPDYVALPNGAAVTVSDIYDMHANKQGSFVITDTAYLYATVIGDESSGNLYKQLYVQDETGGINLQLEASAANVRIGDYVKIVLNGLSVSKYNELMQIGGIDPAYDIIVQRNECYIEPEVVTIKQLNSSDFAYTCKLVRLKNVQFAASDTAGTYADGYAQTSKNLTLTDSLGNEVIVRNSGYANFANKKVIGGSGDAVFIVSRYSSTVQLLIRNINELELTGTRFVLDNEKNVVFSQTFDNSFGNFTTYNVSGEQVWAINYSTATMTGYANSTNYENEDWLISPEIDLSKDTAATFSMNYIARYFSDINNDITLQVSTNYTPGNIPSNATWTTISASWTEGSDWNTFTTTNVDISSYAGKKITVAIKYKSTSNKAGTIEIKSINILNSREKSDSGDEMTFFQLFDTDFGSFSPYNVSGEQIWAISYSTATMNGYANSNNYDNEDWLISSEIDLTKNTEATFTMNYIARYFSDINNDITLQISTNYTAGNAPSSATWSKIDATWTEGSDWKTFATTNVNISAYAGQKITLAIKYVSTSKKAGTLEIKSIGILNKTEAQQGGEGGGTSIGNGTFDNPLSVTEALTASGTKWIKGYIVGVYETKDANGTISTYAMSTIAPFYTATNILIASSASETDIKNCMPVQLPTGDIRAVLNLVDNATNVGKEVMIYGSLEKYFNMPGVKSLTGYWLDGNGINPDNGGGTNNGNTNAIFAEAFDKSQGNFTIHNVEIGSLKYVWKWASADYGIKASAFYNKVQNESESWLVSPAIVIPTSVSSTITLSFQQAANFVSDPSDALHVMVSTDFDGDVENADWTDINEDIATWPSGSDYDFVKSKANISGFTGQTIFVGFKYTSTSSEAATWEIKDFKIE
ncbi:MAG: choice-of-anchor J domain-containing protein [Salinivirgaceae bacterium]|nr:choice-of-anchor J domain-containing protein [Salinivirgaceae bacterium]